MENPLALLLVALMLPSSAMAIGPKPIGTSADSPDSKGLPQWKPSEGSWSEWITVHFFDGNNKSQALSGRRSDYDAKGVGQIHLYSLDCKRPDVRSGRTYCETFLSYYKLDKKSKTVVQGGSSFRADISEQSLSAKDSRIWVFSPKGWLNDKTAARIAPTTQLPKGKKAGETIVKKEKPNPAGETQTKEPKKDIEKVEPKPGDTEKEPRSVGDEKKKDQPKSLEELIRARLKDPELTAFNMKLAGKSDEDKKAVYDEYLPIAAKSLPKDVLAALPPDERKLLCDHANSLFKPDGTALFSKENKALEQARESRADPNRLDTGKGTASAAGSGPRRKYPEALQQMTLDCLNLEPDRAATVNLAATQVPTPCEKKDENGKCLDNPDKKKENAATQSGKDCEKENGKCKETEKKDPNEWLAVKKGAVGSILGLMVGSFFGPVGIAVGIAVAFGLFWGLSKITD